MNRCTSLTAAAILATCTLGAATPAASAQTLDTIRIASAMEWPLFVTHAPGEPYYVYIVLKRGRIVRHDLRTNTQSDFINLDAVVVNPSGVSDERGLLGLAFHPGYEANGYFFVYYTSNTGTQVVARYSRLSPGVGNPDSATILMNMADFATNHNGGWMSFIPGSTDGYLYIATGDGGSANDPQQNGQNINSLLGKMLRIDVDGIDNIPGNGDDGPTGYTSPPTNPYFGPTAGLDEIWAWGLRNPWRNSFDRGTGAFYIADVGQGSWEEINFQAAGAAGGQNYGWRCYEGNAVTGLCGSLPVGVTFPFHVYSHAIGISITGGYVYRGCAIPAISGHYFFADYGSARTWTFSGTSAAAAPTTGPVERTADLAPPIGGGSIASLASFGEDAFGEMYIIRHSTASGEVFRVVPPGNAITDCNGNNVSDCGEFALGLVEDCNGNMQIDTCEITSNPSLDCNDDDRLDSCQILEDPSLDCDGNSVLDSCQIAGNPALDCDNNGVLDSCQLLGDPTLDCDSNNVLDSCQIAANPALDCDGNSLIDSCEIAANAALDCNNDGRLDACQSCFGDADLDNDRDFTDITVVLANFGNNYGLCLVGLGDADKNGIVNFADATAVLANFVQPCP